MPIFVVWIVAVPRLTVQLNVATPSAPTGTSAIVAPVVRLMKATAALRRSPGVESVSVTTARS